MTKRRTAERAVIEAALEWRGLGQRSESVEPGSYLRYVRSQELLEERIDALLALNLEPATATRTISLPMATSEEAAIYMSKSVHRVVGLVFGQILTAYRQGSIGLTTDAIEQRLNRSHQSVSPRVTDLRDQGWIEDSGVKRSTRYGQQAVVWRPSAAALAAAARVKEWSW